MIRALALVLIVAGASAAEADSSGPAPAAKPKPDFKPMPGYTPAKILELVALGDRIYAKAMTHLAKSDPKDNPMWLDENKVALALFQRANQEGYLPAEEEYTADSTVPEQLLDRVRETQMRASLCRKRGVSIRGR